MAYLPLSTANLPDPVIDPAQNESPSDYFDIDTYTGTGATHERSNFTFQPDWLWIKRRSTADNHTSWDSMRGVNKVLKPNETGAEGTDATQISSFDADGFTLLSGGDVNASGQTFVAWCWKANGSGVSNTDGSITSTVSANTKAGFSVITWTGNATLNADIGHGLDSSPEMIIVKNRSVTNSWIVQHHSVTGYLTLNGTGAVAGSNVFTPSSTTIEFDSTWDAINGNGNSMLCYAFHSVEGYSKFGSYTGNGSADGTFVYTGFRPAFLLYKRTDSTGNWLMDDSKTQTVNPDSNYLLANSADAEGDSGSNSAGHIFDMLSNGFKMRNTNSERNASGGTYIYMAFAENPFKYSNAR